MSAAAGPQLELVGITKVYRGGHRALDGLTLSVGTGLLGLLGANGAGKSTIMRIAATVTRPTTGQVRFDGADAVAHPDALRRSLGYLPQDFGVYPNLTAREFLSYLAAAKGLPARASRIQIEELLQLVNLDGVPKRRLGGYSGGMLRRVGIAQALLGNPRLVIVDEPTAGLDPEERVRFRNLLSDLATERVVMLSTHIVSDVESVASDIAVVVAGRLLRRGAPHELLAEVTGRVWEMVVAPHHVGAVQARYPVTRMVRTPDGVRLRVRSSTSPVGDAVAAVADLEDAYLHITASWAHPAAGSPWPPAGDRAATGQPTLGHGDA